MVGYSYLSIIAAVVAAFIVSAVYYAVLGSHLALLSDAYANAGSRARPPAWTMVVEIVRNLAVAVVIAELATRMDIKDPPGSMLLGLGLWLGFPVVLFSGSIVHERYPWRLAAIHAGDWLLKLLVIALIVTLWR